MRRLIWLSPANQTRCSGCEIFSALPRGIRDFRKGSCAPRLLTVRSSVGAGADAPYRPQSCSDPFEAHVEFWVGRLRRLGRGRRLFWLRRGWFLRCLRGRFGIVLSGRGDRLVEILGIDPVQAAYG